MADKPDPFEASASAIGYVYQLRKALHACVELHGNGLDWCLAVEAGDDIEKVTQGGRTYYQLKHRRAGVRLTDASTDLWKTLRIWVHAVTNQRIELEETDLFLLTTANLPEGSAGHFLQPGTSGVRHEVRALELLQAARDTSASTDNRKAYEAFDKLSGEEKRRMVARIQVIGNAPTVNDVKDMLLHQAVLAVDRPYARSFLQRLEGWFLDRAIRQMTTPEMDAITGEEFDQVFTDLRNQFRPENLPIDDDIAVLEPDASDYADKAFVRNCT
ncbi:hypothetical protein ADL25_21075 [Streptomyces sp. NRRL F-5122]|uniref:hypothetical protein n=1 Tax=Streptomyces sp. NRRL F-5122 TaxID=1609098 RepID=UPI0007413B3B|nr:hypothetical protein [Streptomyces sp. NRRL F-5122]KUJ38765.1 hypothetical protein ADL25_21075 [Streptomyces sp. NRRL F-5122]